MKKYHHYYQGYLVKISKSKWQGANISKTGDDWKIISFHKSFINACIAYKTLKNKGIKGLETVRLEIKEVYY